MTIPSTPDSIRETWLQLATDLGVERRHAREVYTQLERRYGESHRVYHTLDHVTQVVRVVQRLASLAHNPARVKMAAWLHDVVYDPRAVDNEERSAAYAATLLRALGQSRPFIVSVQRLILLTKQHRTTAEDADGCVMLDADLAILGAAPQTYDRYAAAIHREYAWLPEARYRTGRIAVLQRFLQRQAIYHTEVMRAEREQIARKNLRGEIARLSAGNFPK